MVKKPEVSIIMNCHNGEKYLVEAINSVLKQTFKNWELIFWNNCSKLENSDHLVRTQQIKLATWMKHLERRNRSRRSEHGSYRRHPSVGRSW